MGDARCCCTKIWLFCCKSLGSLSSSGCQEKRHRRGNVPELVFSLRHERRSISTVLLPNRGGGRPALSPVRGFPWVQCWGGNQSVRLGSHLPNGNIGVRPACCLSVCSTGSPGAEPLPAAERSGAAGQMLAEDKWEGKPASREGAQRPPVFMMKEMEILARILLPVRPTRRAPHAFSPLWQEGRSVRG